MLKCIYCQNDEISHFWVDVLNSRTLRGRDRHINLYSFTPVMTGETTANKEKIKPIFAHTCKECGYVMLFNRNLIEEYYDIQEDFTYSNQLGEYATVVKKYFNPDTNQQHVKYYEDDKNKIEDVKLASFIKWMHKKAD